MNTARLDATRMSARGFTLVELMVSLLIGLFLLGGLVALTGAMKRTSSLQGGLTQLQEDERAAMTIMIDVIQQAGYFARPTVNTAATALPVSGVFGSAGQSVFGVGDTSAASETLSVRYATTGADGVLNCLGASSTTPATWINTFSLDASGNLNCTVTTVGAVGAPVTGTLVTGVQTLWFFYGVQTKANSGNHSVDNYLQAPQVTSGGFWPSVISVQVQLYFTNPLHGAAGQPATVGISRWVALMNMAGVTS